MMKIGNIMFGDCPDRHDTSDRTDMLAMVLQNLLSGAAIWKLKALQKVRGLGLLYFGDQGSVGFIEQQRIDFTRSTKMGDGRSLTLRSR